MTKKVLVGAVFLIFACTTQFWVSACNSTARADPSKTVSTGEAVPTYSSASIHLSGKVLEVSVRGSVRFDKKSKHYIYSYVIKNSLNSSTKPEIFGINPTQRPVEWKAPSHWSAKFGYAGDSDFVWRLVDRGSPPKGWSYEGNNTYPSEFGIAPGDSLGGFSIVSDLKPGIVRFSIQAWDEGPETEDGTAYSEPTPFFSEGATGIIIGPSL